MPRSVPSYAVIAAALLLCVLAVIPAAAQGQGGGRDMGEPFENPELNGRFPGGKGSQATPTPEPSATRTPRATATATATAEPTATATATPTPKPKKRRNGNLPDTGADPLRVGLMGLTLLGFGFSLRLRLAEVRRRN